jgi:acyl-CoA reductase-like NAD-dependent aldehyde dehydrogenase
MQNPPPQRVGMPFEPDVDVGPIVNQAQYSRVMTLLAAAQAEGAKLECGGKRPAGDQFERGYWVQPTIFSGITPKVGAMQF